MFLDPVVNCFRVTLYQSLYRGGGGGGGCWINIISDSLQFTDRALLRR